MKPCECSDCQDRQLREVAERVRHLESNGNAAAFCFGLCVAWLALLTIACSVALGRRNEERKDRDLVDRIVAAIRDDE